ncbi:hypothetical protein C6499_18040 [Candidatus Poribacteria bacterium]|nr:MAG: hypothetical protein C6499_18040 [Candidatus Poribacteria bacterium]
MILRYTELWKTHYLNILKETSLIYRFVRIDVNSGMRVIVEMQVHTTPGRCGFLEEIRRNTLAKHRTGA